MTNGGIRTSFDGSLDAQGRGQFLVNKDDSYLPVRETWFDRDRTWYGASRGCITSGGEILLESLETHVVPFGYSKVDGTAEIST